MTRNRVFSFALSMVMYFVSRPVSNTPRNLKTHHMFSAHSLPEKFENATILITGHFWVRKKNSGMEIIRLSGCQRFKQLLFLKCFPYSQSRHFQISPVWRALSKSSILARISVDGRPNRRNKCVYKFLDVLQYGGRRAFRIGSEVFLELEETLVISKSLLWAEVVTNIHVWHWELIEAAGQYNYKITGESGHSEKS